MSGHFITFEGIEGSGKSTQLRLLAKTLKEKGHPARETREPGGTFIGDQIRAVLLSTLNKNMVPDCELLLYAASRAQHVSEVICPALARGETVLCDRFTDATLSYQGYGRGLDKKTIHDLANKATGGLKPHLTLLFDLPVKDGLARSKARLNTSGLNEKEGRFEEEEVMFHEKVRQGYLEIAAAEPERFVILDARLGMEELSALVLRKVESIF